MATSEKTDLKGQTCLLKGKLWNLIWHIIVSSNWVISLTSVLVLFLERIRYAISRPSTSFSSILVDICMSGNGIQMYGLENSLPPQFDTWVKIQNEPLNMGSLDPPDSYMLLLSPPMTIPKRLPWSCCALQCSPLWCPKHQYPMSPWRTCIIILQRELIWN